MGILDTLKSLKSEQLDEIITMLGKKSFNDAIKDSETIHKYLKKIFKEQNTKILNKNLNDTVQKYTQKDNNIDKDTKKEIKQLKHIKQTETSKIESEFYDIVNDELKQNIIIKLKYETNRFYKFLIEKKESEISNVNIKFNEEIEKVIKEEKIRKTDNFEKKKQEIEKLEGDNKKLIEKLERNDKLLFETYLELLIERINFLIYKGRIPNDNKRANIFKNIKIIINNYDEHFIDDKLEAVIRDCLILLSNKPDNEFLRDYLSNNINYLKKELLENLTKKELINYLTRNVIDIQHNFSLLFPSKKPIKLIVPLSQNGYFTGLNYNEMIKFTMFFKVLTFTYSFKLQNRLLED